MKIQDVAFLVLLAAIMFLARKPKLFAVFGLLLLIISLPLFQLQIFFTAQRLTYYASLLFFLSVLFYSFQKNTSKS